MARARRTLVELACRGHALLLGEEVGPLPGEALIAAIVRALSLWGLIGPKPDAIATDGADVTPEAEALLAAAIEAAHRVGVGQEWGADVSDDLRRVNQGVAWVEDGSLILIAIERAFTKLGIFLRVSVIVLFARTRALATPGHGFFLSSRDDASIVKSVLLAAKYSMGGGG
jgi:hypothetical protein